MSNPSQSSQQTGSAPKEAAKGEKAIKRGSPSSQSRDTREDRGMRQMKNSHKPQTMPHRG